ncbi:uncharacterized protein LOC114598428 [Podarcis muralis]
MERYHLVVLLLCGVFMSRGFSVTYRNFSIDCGTLLPDDPARPQESELPYSVSVPSEVYDPGSEIKVDIQGASGAGFKWFMLQARDIDENIPVGSFQVTDPNTQTHDCYNMTNSALIHKDSEEKHNISSLWVSPDAKKVQFIATVFQDAETYWLVPSIVLFPKLSNETKLEDETKKANVSSKSRKKSVIIKIDCGPGGAHVGSSKCAQGSTFSSQGGSTQGQGVIVYQGGVKKGGGCLAGATANIYNKFGCYDPGVSYGSGTSYGQSVSTVSNQGKSTIYGDKIKAQGSKPQDDIRITIQVTIV